MPVIFTLGTEYFSRLKCPGNTKIEFLCNTISALGLLGTKVGVMLRQGSEEWQEHRPSIRLHQATCSLKTLAVFLIPAGTSLSDLQGAPQLPQSHISKEIG